MQLNLLSLFCGNDFLLVYLMLDYCLWGTLYLIALSFAFFYECYFLDVCPHFGGLFQMSELRRINPVKRSLVTDALDSAGVGSSGSDHVFLA